MFVGNKADLESEKRVFWDRPLREYKEKFDIYCWEVSAKSGLNVKELFAEMVKRNIMAYLRNVRDGLGDPGRRLPRNRRPRIAIAYKKAKGGCSEEIRSSAGGCRVVIAAKKSR